VIIEHTEEIAENFDGTIIDIETIGEFRDQYPDSRRYMSIQMVIFGYIKKDRLRILCARGTDAITGLNSQVVGLIEALPRPFYAFNCGFEQGVLFYQLGKKIDFEGELQEYHESKAYARSCLGIPNYDDPFYDRGFYCMVAWANGEFDAAIAHNRACLLKEKDILLRRGFREPDKMEFIR
jgi:hypothetical protein